MRAPATLLLACLAAAPARAAGLLEARAQGGEGNLVLGALDFSRPVATGTLASVGGTWYSDDSLNATVASLRAGLSRSSEWRTFGLRVLAVPKVEESEAHGAQASAVFHVRTGDPDYRQSTALNAGWVRHDLKVLPKGAPTWTKRHAVLGQGTLEAAFRQSYYGQFHFGMTGAWFYYDRDLTDFRGAHAVLPQTDVAAFGTLSPLASGLPDWTAGVQYSRPAGDLEDVNFSFGWSRIAFHERGLWLNSWLAGLRFEFSDSVSADFGWNGVEGRRGGFRQFFGLHLSTFWK